MKQKYLLLLFLTLFNIPLFAQQQLPREKDDTKTLHLTPQKSFDRNDTYFNEIALKYGNYNIGGYETEAYQFTAARYFTPNLGVKAGVTQLKNLANMQYAWQFPILFSARSTTFTSSVESRRLEDLWFSFLNLIPIQGDASVGVAFGYLTPFKGEPSIEQFHLENRFMASIRADLSLTVYVWRIGVNASVSFQRLLTSNFKKYQPNIYHPDHDKVLRGVFFPSIGVTYRF